MKTATKLIRDIEVLILRTIVRTAARRIFVKLASKS